MKNVIGHSIGGSLVSAEKKPLQHFYIIIACLQMQAMCGEESDYDASSRIRG